MGLALLSYQPAMSAPFIFDDDVAIVENRSIRSLWPISEAMTAAPNTPSSGRPLANLSFAINYALDGLHVEGYHALNLAVHLAAALLLLSAMRTLLARAVVPAWLRARARSVSLVVTLVWLVHPLNSEAVIYVTQRTDLLAALSWLGTIVLAMQGFESPRPAPWYVAAFVTAVLGIGCKEWAATVGLPLLVVDRGYFSRSWRELWERRRWFHASLACALGLALVLALSTPDTYRSLVPSTSVTPLRSLATQAGVVAHYLWLAVWPATLSISYHWPIADHVFTYWPQAVLLCLMLGSSLWGLWRAPWLCLPGAVWFTVLAPSSSFVPIVTEVAAERRMYVPLVAVIVVVIGSGTRALIWLGEQDGALSIAPRALGAIAVCTLLVTSVARTRARASDYRDPVSIWSAAVEAQPRDPRARHGFARALAAADRLGEAQVQATELAGMPANADSKEPWPAIGHTLLGKIAEQDNRLAEALEHYQSALRLAPELPEARFHRGMLLLRRGRPDAALDDFRRAVEDPSAAIRAAAHSNAGLAYLQIEQRALAIEQFLKAIELNPDDVGAWSNLSIAFAQQGQIGPAESALDAALRIAPRDPSLLHNKTALQQQRARMLSPGRSAPDVRPAQVQPRVADDGARPDAPSP